MKSLFTQKTPREATCPLRMYSFTQPQTFPIMGWLLGSVLKEFLDPWGRQDHCNLELYSSASTIQKAKEGSIVGAPKRCLALLDMVVSQGCLEELTPTLRF